MVENITGINAYENMQKIAADAKPSSSVENFSDLVNRAIDNSIDTLRDSERTSAQVLAGEASLDELTAAVSSAETTLRTVTAIRDRIISAYQDIIKMPI